MIRSILALLISLLLFLPALAAADSGAESPELSLYAVNVRKADALLLRCGSSAYLIDTGTEDSAAALLAVLRAEGVTRLDGVILTHTDKDHVGGLETLLRSEIEIAQVYSSVYYNKKPKKHPAAVALKDTGREVIWLSSGDILPLDGGTLEVLGPLVHDEEKENNNSVVLLASGGGGTMLLAGDMEFPEEDTLLKAGLIPRADVLKVGNHGENDATSAALVAAVYPSVAVISTNSEDEPDTPSPRVLRLLEAAGAEVYLTENTKNGVLITLRNGEITAESK